MIELVDRLDWAGLGYDLLERSHARAEAVFLLSTAGSDDTGGEFLLVENRIRIQAIRRGARSTWCRRGRAARMGSG